MSSKQSSAQHSSGSQGSDISPVEPVPEPSFSGSKEGTHFPISEASKVIPPISEKEVWDEIKYYFVALEPAPSKSSLIA